jgi:hypothetical protein
MADNKRSIKNIDVKDLTNELLSGDFHIFIRISCAFIRQKST